MSSTGKYTVRTEDSADLTFSRKDRAIKAGQSLGVAFQVLSPTGAVVHSQVVEAKFGRPGSPEDDLLGDVEFGPDGQPTDHTEDTPGAPYEQAEDEDLNPADETTDEQAESEPLPTDDAVAGESATDTTFDLEKMKAKISALLAKAERTDNEAERDAYNEKAERLMLKLGVHAAELEATGEVKPEEIVEVTFEWKGNYSIVMVPFFHAVARGFGNLYTMQLTRSAMLRKTYVIGHVSDVEQFTSLINSLHLQVMSALHRWQKEHKEERRYLTDMEKYTQHRSFISGFGSTVERRLKETRKQEVAEATPGAALVLASKDSRINAWMDTAYPHRRTARGGMSTHDHRAYSDGRVAGASANIGGTSVRGKAGEVTA